MVVAINLLQRLRRHPEQAGRLPEIRALLHQPGRGRVSEDVRVHVRHPRIDTQRAEGLAHSGHTSTIPFDNRIPTNFTTVPSA